MIDTSVFEQWSRAGFHDLGPDGKYGVFDAYDPGKGHVITARSIDGKWQRSFRNIKDVRLLSDGRSLVLQTGGDSLEVVTLGTDKLRFLSRINSFRVLTGSGGEWLAAMAGGNDHPLMALQQTGAGKIQMGEGILNYWFNEAGNILVLRRQSGESSDYQYEWNDLITHQHSIIWEGGDITQLKFDPTGRQLAFFTRPAKGSSETQLWAYKEGMKRAEQRIYDQMTGSDKDLILRNSFLQFSKDGKRLLFRLSQAHMPVLVNSGVRVDIWNTRDLVLEEGQLAEANLTKQYAACLDLSSNTIARLEGPNSRLVGGIYSQQGRSNYTLAITGELDQLSDTTKPLISLQSLENGQTTPIKGKISNGKERVFPYLWVMSPDEQYVLYSDPFKGRAFSYQTDSGIHREMNAGAFISVMGVAGWIKEKMAVIVYDEWDIWRMDLRGIERPVNLTNGYGRRHHTQLRLTTDEDLNRQLPEDTVLLLAAFDTARKYSGYFRMRMSKPTDPELLTMGPYRYGFARKAEKADVWIVQRQSAEECANFYATRDFKQFTTMTHVTPEKQYNWLKAELVNWPLPDGTLCQGMLFKPEDLDPTKHYPLLINYYRGQSNELYHYREPEASRDDINIPYFVSRGYVVFVPDIHDREGAMGQSALESVISGIRHLSKQSWLDTTKIGLQAHSFGAYETNHIITHSHHFAAAVEACGVSDMLSDYDSVVETATPNQGIFETGQYQIGATLWEKPSRYLDNSAVLRADQVTTPLLMMHNKRDDLVPWQQGVEFFLALRRNGKRAWMLQYDNGTHFVQGEDAIDYTIRMEQFFDYYLKGAPPPKWMTEGIPAEKKGLDRGYELDLSGKVP